jgi:hypothetical protein
MRSLRRQIFASTVFACGAVTLATVTRAESPQNDERIAIEPLLKSGWQIAGYASSSDNRSTHILFKHPSETYLVQCSAGYDVTRETRVFENCYKLK